MKRVLLIVGVLVLAAFLWLGLTTYRKYAARPENHPSAEATATGVQATATSIPTPPTGAPTLLIGETILRDYAKPDLPPANDLTLMSRLMDNSLLLLKSAANRSLSANEDWAGLLRGENAAHERFLPDAHVALGADGKLVDRWGTPLFFHALGGGRFEIRSAGPDQKMWTADDIHRNADGTFRRGAELNPPSLLDAAAHRSAR